MQVFPIIPDIVKDLVGNARNFSLPGGNYWCAKDFLMNAQRVVLAAAICFAAYKGSMIAAGVLATFSLPAATLAGGAMALKYGYTALKAGILAKQLSQAAIGTAALYAGWQALDNYREIAHMSTWGLFDGDRTYGLWSVSHAIAKKFGYDSPPDDII